MIPTTPTVVRSGRQGAVSGWLILAILAVVALLAVSLLVGQYSLFAQADGAEMFFITRAPRTIALVLAGAAMSVCGIILQLLSQNKFVSPTTTGATDWAGLGLLLVMILVPNASVTTRMIGAVTMAFIGSMVFFLFLRRVQLTSSLLVPIVGIMFGAVVSAITTYLAITTNMLQNLGIWFAGSFIAVYQGQYEVLWIAAVAVLALFVVSDRFTVAGLGKDVATNAGVNYEQVMLLGAVIIAIATGVTTVVVGNLPFLGLIVPNLVSAIRGDDLRSNLPWVALTGVAIVTVCDILARTVRAPFEVPVSLILGVVGSVVFIVLLLRRYRCG